MSSWWTPTREGIVKPGRLIWAYGLSAPALAVVEQFRWFRQGFLEKEELFEIRKSLLEDS